MNKHTKFSFAHRRATCIAAIFSILLLAGTPLLAQDIAANHKMQAGENYGNTLNLGIGIGYYGYLGQSVPFLFADYEFKVSRNFTIAPFLGYTSYKSYNDYLYGGSYYYYHETVIPVGAKGTYYFDELLNLNPKWDLYGALSLGWVYDNVVWDNGYNGNTGNAHKASPLSADLHAGAEYHFNRRLGLYLDLSTGVSTVGIAIHHR